MRKLNGFIVGLTFLCVSSAMAADRIPAFVTGAQTQYVITQSTKDTNGIGMSIASNTVVTLPASAWYKTTEVQFFPSVLQDGTSVFMQYGSTIGVVTNGFIVRLSTAQAGSTTNPMSVTNATFEANQSLNFQLAPGISTTVPARYTQRKLQQ